MKRLLSYLPRGNTLDDEAFARRHRLLQWVLGIHLPALAAFGIILGWGVLITLWVIIPPAVLLALGHAIPRRRPASIMITAGLTYCSAALVGLTYGSIEAHFHFFIIIGFIALYQDWVPFLWNVIFTVLSHGLGSVWESNLIFNHPAGQLNPWLWSGIHGAAVAFACVGMVIFWRVSEEEQQKREELTRQLADAEINRRQFTSDLLVNLARRNQSMLYRQLDIINQLEDKERDPDALAELFRLDHLATRVRRNAESLLVLSGEQPTRVWSAPVPLRDVVRAAIAETEDLERVVFAIDEKLAVAGHSVTDVTHLLAELTENAVRFSPPQASVSIRTRPYLHSPGAFLVTVEDWGVGMPVDDIAEANELFANPPEIDLAVSQRLGFHVVARLAQRHGIGVSLTPTPGCGVTAVIVLPGVLFDGVPLEPAVVPARVDGQRGSATRPDPVGAGRGAKSRDESSMARSSSGRANRSGAPVGAMQEQFPVDNADAGAERAEPEAPAVSEPAVSEPIVPERLVVAVPEQAWPTDGPTDGPGGLPGDSSWDGWWRATVPEQAQSPEQVAGDRLAAGDAVARQVQVRSAEPLQSPSRQSPSPRARTPQARTPQDGGRSNDARASGTVPRAPVANGHGASADGTDGPGTGPRDGTPAHRTANGGSVAPAANKVQPGADRPSAEGTGAEGSGAEPPGPRLNRRVPQSHLAPELRDAQQPAEGARPPSHTAAASDALSRYQASRQAAQAKVNGETNGAHRAKDTGRRT